MRTDGSKVVRSQVQYASGNVVWNAYRTEPQCLTSCKKRKNKVTVVALKWGKSHNSIQKKGNYIYSAGQELLLHCVNQEDHNKALVTVPDSGRVTLTLKSNSNKPWQFALVLISKWLWKGSFSVSVRWCLFFKDNYWSFVAQWSSISFIHRVSHKPLASFSQVHISVQLDHMDHCQPTRATFNSPGHPKMYSCQFDMQCSAKKIFGMATECSGAYAPSPWILK